MKNLENFLDYVIENFDDERIHISKKVKYGFRHYSVSINLPTKNSRDITIIVDTKNNTLEVGYDFGINVILESQDLTKKWADILEKKYSEDLESKFDSILSDFMSQTEIEGKDFWREWTMKEIFKNDKKSKIKNKKS